MEGVARVENLLLLCTYESCNDIGYRVEIDLIYTVYTLHNSVTQQDNAVK